MNKFVRNLLTEWRRLNLPFEDETIVAAVSGGADSVSLVLALHDLKKRKKLNLNFIVAHFNHNLRGIEGDKDAEFVCELAEKLNFKFQISISKSQIKNQKGNLEQNARSARYEFLRQIATNSKAYAILTAHTKNDQAETLLLNLIRGSGLDGLSGMKPVRYLEGEKTEQLSASSRLSDSVSPVLLVRPLINWACRMDTEKFCFENNIEFRHDLMNDDLNFTRVKVRREIIPLLEKINPRIIDTLSTTANLLSEEADNLKINEQDVPEILSQKELKNLSKSMRMSVLRTWLLNHRGNLRELDMKHFEAIERLIYSRKSGRIVQLPTDQRVLKREGKVFFEK